MKHRILLPAIVLAILAPATALGGDALQKLYQLDRERAQRAGAATHQYVKPDAAVVSASPVRSVMHLHRTPDGELVLQCRIEHGPVDGGDRDATVPREVR